MKTRLGLFVVVLLAMAALSPAAALAGPTRAMDAEITGVSVSGLMGPGGEYPAGDLIVTVTITNNLDSPVILDNQEIILNITDISDGSVHVNTSKIVTVGLGALGSQDIEMDSVNIPEGDFNITVNATIRGENSIFYLEIMVMNVIDLSIQNSIFEQDGEYDMGESISPKCNVKYVGNVVEWKDNVNVHLIIETVADVSVTLYDGIEQLMTTSSSPVSPSGDGYIFPTLMFQTAWLVDTPGEVRATFSVDYDNYNETNNTDVVTFFVNEPASVEGYALTPDDSPIPMVNIEVRDDTNALIEVQYTNETGYFSVYDLADGNYSLIFGKQWFDGETVNFTAKYGTTEMINGTLTPLDLCGLEGYVYDPADQTLFGAAVVAQKVGGGFFTEYTNETGYYMFDDLESGTYQIRATYTGFDDASVDQILLAREMNEVNLHLGETPFTVIFDPPTGEPGFYVGGSISLLFSRPIDQSSVDPFTIILKNSMTGTAVDVEFDFNIDNTSVVITPIAVLEFSTNYSIEVTHWVRDVNGAGFPDDKISYFITEDQIFNVSIISRSPGVEQDNVPVNTVIRVIFSGAMNGSTITETTFKLFARGSEAIAGTVFYYESNNTAMFVPSAPLEYGMRYSVDMSDVIQAQSPDYIFLGEGWNFDTMEEVSEGEIKGRVLDENGDPFPTSNVSVKIMMGQQMRTQMVNMDGDFNFLELDEGVWTLTINVDGYDTYTHNVTVTAGESFDIGTVGMAVTPVDDGGDGGKDENYTWIIILVAFLVIVFIFLIIVFAVQGRQKPVEAEEVDRRPRFGVRGREEAGYDEYFEGEFMCPMCGGVTSSDDDLCPNCGAEFEEDLFECPECGSSITGDAPECPDCGAIFEEEEEPEEEEDLYDEDYEEDITDEYEVEEEESGYERYMESEEEPEVEED